MPTPKSPSTKPKRAKAETQRQFEEIREEVTLAKAWRILSGSRWNRLTRAYNRKGGEDCFDVDSSRFIALSSFAV